MIEVYVDVLTPDGGIGKIVKAETLVYDLDILGFEGLEKKQYFIAGKFLFLPSGGNENSELLIVDLETKFNVFTIWLDSMEDFPENDKTEMLKMIDGCRKNFETQRDMIQLKLGSPKDIYTLN